MGEDKAQDLSSHGRRKTVPRPQGFDEPVDCLLATRSGRSRCDRWRSFGHDYGRERLFARRQLVEPGPITDGELERAINEREGQQPAAHVALPPLLQ